MAVGDSAQARNRSRQHSHRQPTTQNAPSIIKPGKARQPNPRTKKMNDRPKNWSFFKAILSGGFPSRAWKNDFGGR
jgi:hypothetical protein